MAGASTAATNKLSHRLSSLPSADFSARSNVKCRAREDSLLAKTFGVRSLDATPFPPAVWTISASVAVVESRNFRDSVAEIMSDRRRLER
jgi:hypothetical protein